MSLDSYLVLNKTTLFYTSYIIFFSSHAFSNTSLLVSSFIENGLPLMKDFWSFENELDDVKPGKQGV